MPNDKTPSNYIRHHPNCPQAPESSWLGGVVWNNLAALMVTALLLPAIEDSRRKPGLEAGRPGSLMGVTDQARASSDPQ